MATSAMERRPLSLACRLPIRAPPSRRAHRSPNGLHRAPWNFSTKTAQRVGILPGEPVSVVVSSPVYGNALGTPMTIVEVGVGEQRSVGVTHAEYRIAIQCPSCERVSFRTWQAWRSAVIVVLSLALGMPIAQILNLMRGRVAPRVVERVVDSDSRYREPDHPHRQTAGFVRSDRYRGNLERQILSFDAVGVGVVLIGRVLKRDWKDARRLPDWQAIACDGQIAAMPNQHEIGLWPHHAALHVWLFCGVPGVAMKPWPGVARAHPKCSLARVHAAGGWVVGDTAVANGETMCGSGVGSPQSQQNAC